MKRLLGSIGVLLILGFGGVLGWEAHRSASEKGCVAEDGAIAAPPLVRQEEGAFELPVDDPARVRLLAVGDAGTGDADQQQVAAAMQQVCATEGCDAVLFLGDNLYPDGARDVRDVLFQTHFEAVYSKLQLPFLVVLGNHDVHQQARTEILYTRYSEKWRLPAAEYTIRAGSVELHALNTNCPLQPWRSRPFSRQHPWQVVFAHHPVFSAGTHGDTDLLSRWLARERLSGWADFYLSGHDHFLAHLQHPELQTHFIVSGAGGKHYRDETEANLRQSEAELQWSYRDTGFVWVEFTPQQASLRFYDAQAQLLHTVTQPRSG